MPRMIEIPAGTIGWLRRAWDRLQSGYWLVPLSCVAVAVASAFGLIALDRYVQDRDSIGWTYAGGPQNASDTLTTIASSMITFTGLVFSITVLALQLTSSQFSPRALRNFLGDRVSQFSLGIFIATFAYSFAALSAVRVASEDDPSFVPSFAVTGAFLLIGVSLVMFVRYISHTAQSIRAVNIIERIAADTRQAIDAVYPHPASDRGEHASAGPAGDLPDGAPSVLVGSRRGGVVVDIDLDGLATCAGRQDAAVEVLHPIGTYVCEGQPLMRVSAVDLDGVDVDPMQAFVHRDSERTMRGDPAFGLRQLVDIAERALSPGINDPTTAVQCLDRIHDMLRRLIGREIPAVRTGEHEGTVRAAAPSPSFAELVQLATEEIGHWGRDSIQVQRRLRSLFDDLIEATECPDRRGVLRHRRDAIPAPS